VHEAGSWRRTSRIHTPVTTAQRTWHITAISATLRMYVLCSITHDITHITIDGFKGIVGDANTTRKPCHPCWDP
jgi:hypothetical protein